MLVKHWMSKILITIDQDETMNSAIKLMKENGIKRLPVTKRGRLVGILSQSDIKEASPSKATTLEIHELTYLLSQIKVKDIMTKNPITISVNETAEEAALKMHENRIGCLPVMDGEILAGIITETDLFKVLIDLTGIKEGGIQFGVKVPDKPGSIKPVADIIRSCNGRIVSILTTYSNVEEGKRKVFFRAKGIDRAKIDNIISEIGNYGELLYLIDSSQKQRIIYEKEE